VSKCLRFSWVLRTLLSSVHPNCESAADAETIQVSALTPSMQGIARAVSLENGLSLMGGGYRALLRIGRSDR
jgi:hypothetical protein